MKPPQPTLLIDGVPAAQIVARMVERGLARFPFMPPRESTPRVRRKAQPKRGHKCVECRRQAFKKQAGKWRCVICADRLRRERQNLRRRKRA